MKQVIDSGFEYHETMQPEDPKYLEVCRLVKKAEGYCIPRNAAACFEPKGWCLLEYNLCDDVSFGHWDTKPYPYFYAMRYEDVPTFLESIIAANK